MIKTERLNKTYQIGPIKVPALRGVDIEIKSGEFIAIMGPSGSGKSTLMHILGMLDRPSSGHYYFKSRKIDELNDTELSATRNREIGFVFQFFNLLPHLTILQNVELPLAYGGVVARRRRERARAALEKVGLAGRMNHLPTEISGGERQRAAIARALVTEPSVIMADEPTGNLDTRTGKEILNLFKEINQRGTTIILVTHEEEIARFSQRIIFLRDGEIIKIVPTNEL
ncbi:ABC transporter ATP-binding protein [Candidatus Sumerlaeota bacterium]|nr:ABC transporter ATP-binding protein [Candidatus Sumerlaeota bacterium]